MLYVVRQPDAREVWTSTFRFRSSSSGAKSSFFSSTNSRSNNDSTTRRPKPSTAGEYRKPIDATRISNNNSTNVTNVNNSTTVVNNAANSAIEANAGSNLIYVSYGAVTRANLAEEENDSGIVYY